jgi:hypothetical protein
MARCESDREDLFNEATAFVRKAELTGLALDAPVVVGFRKDGGLSIYFGGDPVYHLGPERRLKRAFHSGRLYRREGDTIAELVRERTPAATILRRRDLSRTETAAFLNQMAGRITDLVAHADRGLVTMTRQQPQDDAAIWADFKAAVAVMNARLSFTDRSRT